MSMYANAHRDVKKRAEPFQPSEFLIFRSKQEDDEPNLDAKFMSAFGGKLAATPSES